MTVRDNGPGFDPSATKTGRTGLGLALVRRLRLEQEFPDNFRFEIREVLAIRLQQRGRPCPSDCHFSEASTTSDVRDRLEAS